MADDIGTLQNQSLRPPRGAGPVRFTWDDVIAMDRARLFGEIDRVELLDGELRITPVEGDSHRLVLQTLIRWLLDQFYKRLELDVRGALKLSDTTHLIPDASLMPMGFNPKECLIENAELILEVSDSTLKHDLTVKKTLYAKASAKELWIVDTNTRTLFVHRDPKDGAFKTVLNIQPGQSISPLCDANVSFDPASLPTPADFD
jgi:Uma2 family endonuclease